MRRSAWFVLALAPAFVGGCGIQASYEKLSHEAPEAVVVDGNLHVRGWIRPDAPPVNYGVKVFEAADDTGRQLAFRSLQRAYAKGTWFDLELSEPAPTAKTVTVDVAFASGGVQRVRWELPIQRDGRPWFPALSWAETPPQSTSKGGK